MPSALPYAVLYSRRERDGEPWARARDGFDGGPQALLAPPEEREYRYLVVSRERHPSVPM